MSIPTREYIDCPFEQKEEAKALGARWDSETRKWYAPTQEIYAQLTRWHIKPKTALPKPKISKSKASSSNRRLRTSVWERTGESQEDYNKRQSMGSYYKGQLGGVPSAEQYKMMKSEWTMTTMSTAYDTRGD
jgi:hypothetical protein